MSNETSTIVLGQPGVGKSFFMKAKLNSTLCGNENASVYLCGEPNEYQQIMDSYSGKEIDRKSLLDDSAPRFCVLNSKKLCEFDLEDILKSLQEKPLEEGKEVYLFIDDADSFIRSKSLADKILKLPKNNISAFLTATNVLSSFSDFVFDCDSAIILLKDQSDFSTYSKVLGFNKHQFETEYDQTNLSVKDGTLFALIREKRNEDFISKTYHFEL